ncbi:MAG: NrfD/PsrC family molybdoenzyme membrane anchor subunit [bacterium]
MTRSAKVKTILWFICGWAAVIAAARMLRGLGATTALSDKTPWGLWIGFDVVSGVALAAGGFVVAAAVYIFHRGKYHEIARPAVLTAFLGYGAVIVGLIFDIGLPWNIWHPMVMWQHHSALFEVAWCVMLYFTVLALEFSPALFQNSKFQGIYRSLKNLTVPLVILGIILSVLHQSSLGTLFVIMPHRIHSLFYSPIQNVHFLISAIALGLLMVMFEHHVTAWLYERGSDAKLMEGLGRAAAAVLAVYFALKIGDLAVRGDLDLIAEGSAAGSLFIVEMALAAVIPAALLAVPGVRATAGGQVTCASIGISGMVLNRLNVSGLSMVGVTGSLYAPSWMELSVSAGIVAAAALVFFFVMENFPVHEEHAAGPADEKGADEDNLEIVRFDLPGFDGSTGVWMGDHALAARRRYSFAFILAVALCFAFLPKSAVRGLAESLATPVARPTYRGNLFVLDGDRAGKSAPFDHERHRKLAGGENACGACHHMNAPPEKTTPCRVCHADMYLKTDIFRHVYHQEKLGGNTSCAKCHADGALKVDVKKTCNSCHEEHGNMFAERPQATRMKAPGYKDAMHGGCIPCHKEKAVETGKPDLGVCSTCHYK